jgi:nicotinic acid mononucleotide adenylyltransferase
MNKIVQKDGHEKAIFTFGRFQPPTVGHALIISAIDENAKADNADAYVFVSSSKNNMNRYVSCKAYKEMQRTGSFTSYDANQNPLSVKDKIEFLNLMHPEKQVEFIDTTENQCTNIFTIVDKLLEAGYKSLEMVVGSDRVKSFRKILKEYENLQVVSAGNNRNNRNSSGLKGVSGTKMRFYAVNNDFKKFKEGVMMGIMKETDAFRLMNKIREGLGYNGVKSNNTRKNNTHKNNNTKATNNTRRNNTVRTNMLTN